MSKENLYNSPYVANKIKELAKAKKISLKDILFECDLGSNTFSHMLHGRSLAFDSLAKIADCLDCSVDYLLGRTDNPEINKITEETEKVLTFSEKSVNTFIRIPEREKLIAQDKIHKTVIKPEDIK